MAIFRKLHVSFWDDSWVSSLTVEQRYFYIYLLTNSRTSQCGIYEITKKQIAFDTGYSIDRVSNLLSYFIKHGKIRYNESTSEIAIKNWVKFNESRSPKVKTLIDKELAAVKDRVLIQYLYSMDTQCAIEEEEEQEEESEENENKNKAIAFYENQISENEKEGEIENYKAFVSYLNSLKPDHFYKVRDQLTYRQFLTLKEKEKYPGQLKEKLDSLINKKKYTKDITSIYLTINNWMNLDAKR